MPSLDLLWLDFESEQWQRAIELRRQVLRLPLGLDFTPEELAAESNQSTLGAFHAGALVGCLMMVPVGESAYKMRQVAVAPELQGKGLGKQMVAEAEDWTRRNGRTEIQLHARESAVPFYESLSYVCEGEPFVEVGLMHRMMRKRIN